MAEKACPWWVGYFLLNPFRYLTQNPEKILSPYIKNGMNTLEVGSGMGYFSLPMAKLVGKKGSVQVVELQKEMINTLNKRVKKAGLINVSVRQCMFDSLMIEDLDDNFDFALLFAVAHEVPDQERLFGEIYKALEVKGTLLFAEPKGHVNQNNFEASIEKSKTVGFKIVKELEIKGNRAILLQK